MSQTEPVEYIAPNNSVFEIGCFTPSDALSVATLFRSVYGDGYPIRIFYKPESIIDANLKGQYISIVGRNAEQEIVGVMHLFRSAPYERIYELGVGLVLKPFRGLGLSKALLDFVFNRFVPARNDIEGIYGEPVCNHLIMQKACLELSCVETAIEVALMPAEAYAKESTSLARVATTFASKSYRSRPHTVFLPAQYDGQLRFIYSGMTDRRDLRTCEKRAPEHVNTTVNVTIFDFAKVARLAFQEVGQDFESELGNVETQALDQEAVVIQAWLKLTTPCLEWAVKILRGKGYFLGGVLPHWFNDDGILLQKVLVDPEFEKIQLNSLRTLRLLDMIREDWKITNKC